VLNYNTSRGAARAVKLSSLSKLATVKGNKATSATARCDRRRGAARRSVVILLQYGVAQRASGVRANTFMHACLAF
jgi:hypothetical protein